MRTCMLKTISREPIGYNTKIGTGGVEWGRVDIWIVLHTSFEVHGVNFKLVALLF